MVSDACVISGEYEPESYQEMRNDLNKLILQQKKLFQGFYPSDWSIAIDINYQYAEDIDDCAFCFVERKDNLVIFKTESEYHAEKLFEDLKKEKQWHIYWIENSKRWDYEAPWKKHLPIILEIEKHPETEEREGWIKITCSYWMLKPILKKAILDQIYQHKDFMQEMRSEYDDAPLDENDWQIADLKSFMGDAIAAINCTGDCDLVIEILNKGIRQVEEKRIELPNDEGQITF